jgi:DNA primase
LIPKETIDEIFNACVIEDVVGDFVTLKKRGANYLGNCPFHNEKTPSFTVSPAKGIYKCFGCGKAGNAVNFIMEHEHYTYPEALKYLADKYQIEVEEEEQSDAQIEAANEKESLYIVSNFAAKYFVDQLLNTDKGKAIGLSYFEERGFTPATIEKFQLGYSPDEWTAFTDEALNSGYDLKYLEKSGLTIVKENKKFDRFKGRVMFPIHNLSGRVLGFGGRILINDKKAAKYINSPESEIYDKSNVLYGIYFAKKSMVQEDNCFLVEGYTDVISLSQAGVENVVASSGTSLTEGQIRLISRYTKNITILYDGDVAGIKASFRGIDMILQEGMNVKVVLFPDGEDPDSFAKKSSTEELKDYIGEKAQDFIQFKISVLLEESGKDPIKRAELIKDIVSSIALIPDQIKRAVYTKECSVLLEISEQALINEINKILRKKLSKSSSTEQDVITATDFQTYSTPEKKAASNTDLLNWEKEIIRLLINYAENNIKVKVKQGEQEETREIPVVTYILHALLGDEIEFTTPAYQEIFMLYNTYLKDDKILPQQALIQHENDIIKNIAIDVLSTKYELNDWSKHNIVVSTENEQLQLAVINSVHAFKLSKVKHLIKQTQEKLKNADETEQLEIIQQIMRLEQIKAQLSNKLGIVILE